MLGLRLQLQIDLQLDNPAVGAQGVRERVFLLKKRGESLDHVLMKLLAYGLFYSPELKIEVSAEQHYKPDLLRVDERGEPVQWVDCGSTALRKLDRITRRNRKTVIDIVKRTERELRLFKESADERIDRPERVRYWAFADGFIERLGERVRGRHTLRMVVDEQRTRLVLWLDEELLETPIIHLG